MTSDYYARRAYDKTLELEQKLRRLEDAQKADHRSLAAAFDRMAGSINALAREVHELREEISPKPLDKPKLKPFGHEG